MLRVTVVLALFVLAGCAGPPAMEGHVANDAGASGGADSEQSEAATDPAEPEPPNSPPEARMVANITEGMAPLKVIVQLEGSDPDGDALSWSIDAEDDGVIELRGDGLPEEIWIRYSLPGNFTARMFVTDGEATVNVTQGFVVHPSPEPPAQNEGSGPVAPAPMVFQQSFRLTAPAQEESSAMGITVQPSIIVGDGEGEDEPPDCVRLEGIDQIVAGNITATWRGSQELALWIEGEGADVRIGRSPLLIEFERGPPQYPDDDGFRITIENVPEAESEVSVDLDIGISYFGDDQPAATEDRCDAP